MNLDAEFERCTPWIEAALEYTYGTHDLQSIRDGVEDGRYQFFFTPRGCAITQVSDYPLMRVLSIILYGGELENALEYLPMVEGWAAEQGCERVEITGRRGWVQALGRDAGYREAWTTVIKELPDGERTE